MTKVVGLDIGHGSNTFPASGKGVRANGVGYAEHSFNSKLALKIKSLLENSGVKVVMYQQPYSPDTPLSARTDWFKAQGVDLIISVHANANGNNSVNGRCVFYWHTSASSRNIAQLLVSEIGNKGYSLHGNGLHASLVGSWTNLHMTRVPASWGKDAVPSILAEYGFMTGSRDFNLIFGSQQDKYTTDMAEATAIAITKFFGLSFKNKNVTVKNPTNTITPSNSETYTVKAGDTLWAIAQANGVSVEELKRMNNLNSNIINPSQKLIVKVKSDKKDEVILTRPETYTIQAGDTLGEIATEFDIRMQDLISWNNISNPNVIVVGDTLKLKGNATIPTQKPTNTSPRFIVGERVRVKQSARTYTTGEPIPDSIKGRTYTIMQLASDRVLLQEIMSWVRRSDVEGSGGSTTSAPAPKPASTRNVTNYKGSSITDYLNLAGNRHLGGSSFANRKKLAEVNGIRNYTGTASQNKELLRKLQGGSVQTTTRSVNVNDIAEQIKKGVDNRGRKIPIGNDARRKHFGLTTAEYERVRARVNQIM